MPEFQHRVGAQNIDQYSEPLRINKTTLQAEVVDLDAAIALSDPQLNSLITLSALSKTNAQDLRDFWTDLKEKTQQRIRIWELDTQVLAFSEILPTFLHFDVALGGAVQSFCGEEVADPATNVLAALNKWAHLVNEQHSITLDLGNPEVIDAINIPIEVAANNAHQLRGVDVFAAKVLANIDDPINKMITAFDFATVGSDNIKVFLNPKNGGTTKRARFVKLVNIDTDNPTNNMRIKEILVRVLPKFFGE